MGFSKRNSKIHKRETPNKIKRVHLKFRMKLLFYINSEGEKVYTLKEEFQGKRTNEAHYKLIKIRDAPKSDINIVRKN